MDDLMTLETITWDELPVVNQLHDEKEIIALRKRLPKAKMGHWLQAYKYALSVRLRKIRSDAGGKRDWKAELALIINAPKCCPDCGWEMKHRGSYASATIDHIIPLARGGTNHISNLRVICHRCNARKSDRPTTWGGQCATG